MRTSAVTIPLAAALVLAFSAPVSAAAEDPREMEGRALFAKGEYHKALDIYAALFAENADPLYLRNIGRCYQKLRVPDKAIDAFREYLRRSPGLKPAEQTEVEGFIKDMEALRREQAASPPPAPPPDLRVREPSVAVGSAPAAAVVTQPEPTPDRPVYTRWWFWTAAAVVAAGAVITAVALSGSPAPVGNCQGVPDCVRVKN